MPPPEIEREERDMLARLGWSASPFWKVWAKLEIFLGLLAFAAGIIGALKQAVAQALTLQDAVWLAWASYAALLVLGGYLALAGHRSHLYQSNNRIAAYLAERVRLQPHPTPPRDRT